MHEIKAEDRNTLVNVRFWIDLSEKKQSSLEFDNSAAC